MKRLSLFQNLMIERKRERESGYQATTTTFYPHTNKSNILHNHGSTVESGLLAHRNGLGKISGLFIPAVIFDYGSKISWQRMDIQHFWLSGVL